MSWTQRLAKKTVFVQPLCTILPAGIASSPCKKTVEENRGNRSEAPVYGGPDGGRGRILSVSPAILLVSRYAVLIRDLVEHDDHAGCQRIKRIQVEVFIGGLVVIDVEA